MLVLVTLLIFDSEDNIVVDAEPVLLCVFVCERDTVFVTVLVKVAVTEVETVIDDTNEVVNRLEIVDIAL